VSVAGGRVARVSVLGVWGCFQRGMSLNGSCLGSIVGAMAIDICARWGSAGPSWRGRGRSGSSASGTTRGATRTVRRCSSALPTLSQAGGQGTGAALCGPHHAGYSRQQLTRQGSRYLATGGLT
jgi:hypothetical protein